jgi:hypothetical protein
VRRVTPLAALLFVLTLLACTPGSAPLPAPPLAKPGSAPTSAVKTGPGSWEDTDLPTSAAPGSSSDDSARDGEDEGRSSEKRGPSTRLSADAATPRVVPTVTRPTVPADLTQEVYVEGLMLPVAFELAPDGRQLFVNELYGKVRLVENGQLKPAPVVVLPTTQGLEQGALGLALDPAFARNHSFASPYFSDHHAIYRLGRPR